MSTEGGPELTPLERSEARADQLSEALESRSVIARAQGILMERYGIDADAAIALLKRLSSGTNTKLVLIAEVIAAGTAIDDLEPPAPRTEPTRD